MTRTSSVHFIFCTIIILSLVLLNTKTSMRMVEFITYSPHTASSYAYSDAMHQATSKQDLAHDRVYLSFGPQVQNEGEVEGKEEAAVVIHKTIDEALDENVFTKDFIWNKLSEEVKGYLPSTNRKQPSKVDLHFNAVYDPLENERKNSSIFSSFIVSPFFISGSKHASPDAVTALTTVTMDRLDRLKKIGEMWFPSPVSAAILINKFDQDDIKAIFSLSKSLQSISNIDVHLLINPEDKPVAFPNNALRQLAAECARTELVFNIDVDFIPSHRLHSALAEYSKIFFAHGGVDVKSGSTSYENFALVVPAFESILNSSEVEWRKENVIKLWEEKVAMQFHVGHFPNGHAPTKYDKWIKTSKAYMTNHMDGYEPYTVLAKPFPAFDERFRSGWKDKISHVSELVDVGYKFVVLPDEFIIHLPHPNKRIEKITHDPAMKDFHKFLREVKDRERMRRNLNQASKHSDLIMTGYVHPGVMAAQQTNILNPKFNLLNHKTGNLTISDWNQIECSKDIPSNSLDVRRENLVVPHSHKTVTKKNSSTCAVSQTIFLAVGADFPYYSGAFLAMHLKVNSNATCYMKAEVCFEDGKKVERIEIRSSPDSHEYDFNHMFIEFDDLKSKDSHIKITSTNNRPVSIEVTLGVTSESRSGYCEFKNVSMLLLPMNLPERRITPNIYIGDRVQALEEIRNITMIAAATIESIDRVNDILQQWSGPASIVFYSATSGVASALRKLKNISMTEHWDKVRLHFISFKSLQDSYSTEDLLSIARIHAKTASTVTAKSLTPRNLLFTSAGDHNSLFTNWFGANMSYDTFCVYYGRNSTKFKEYQERCTYTVQSIGSKSQNVYRELYLKRRSLVQAYDFFFLLDDDIKFDNGVSDINKMFDRTYEYSIAISMPSFRNARHLRADWYSNHHRGGLELQFVNLVEVNSMLMSQEAFLNFMGIYDPRIIGWGADAIAVCANGHSRRRAYAVIHSVICENPYNRDESSKRELSKLPGYKPRGRTYEKIARDLNCPVEKFREFKVYESIPLRN